LYAGQDVECCYLRDTSGQIRLDFGRIGLSLSFVPISHPQKLPLASREVERALTGLKNIPFEQVGHFAQLGDFVRDLHANERICDDTVHIGTKQYTVHRISLAREISLSAFSDSLPLSSNRRQIQV
jgi:hypothetical protein